MKIVPPLNFGEVPDLLLEFSYHYVLCERESLAGIRYYNTIYPMRKE